ncbi:hypothetical protein ACVIYL_008967 [Bradyrhizobium sp. USDA 3315]
MRQTLSGKFEEVIRYGYRRVHALCRREGWPHGTPHLWRMGLQLRNKAPKRQVKAKLRDDL